ncbi:MAG: S-layer protein [Candidatus Aenigmarchaeota archaeon]|nr:S-layer protein [Candidatus Aenigmarchaeota archaeon]
MNNKIVASFMTALMAAMVLVSPALGATALNTYPTFLGKAGDFYVVVGSKAAASDVAGAIDVASNLAQLSYNSQSVGSTTSSTGTTDRKIVIPSSSTTGAIGGTTANTFPVQLKNFHYTGLQTGQFAYRGTNHNYHEEVVLSTTDPNLKLTHSISSPVNGTLKMRVENNATTSRYYFDDAIKVADFMSSGSAGNTTSGMNTYQNPVDVTVAGQHFLITSVPATTSFVALVGSVKTLSDGDSMTVGDLTFKVVQSFSSTTAKIEISDASGNVVKTGINTGSTESVSFGGSTYNYRVLNSGATASGVLGYAQVLAGKGDIEKTFDNSDTATISAWGTDWKIAGTFATAGQISSGDHIDVKYAPASLTDANRYFLQGATFKGPGDYWEIKYDSFSPSNFATVTITPVTGITVYNSTASTGYSTIYTDNTGGASSLNGLKITSDVAGTVLNGSTGYDEMYVLFNGSGSATTWNNTQAAWWLAYKDKATGRVVNADQTGAAGQWPASVLDPAVGGLAEGQAPVNITLSYGGPGASATYYLLGWFSSQNLFSNVTVSSSISGGGSEVLLAFQNKTASATSSAPEFRLGATTASADSNDVRVDIEGTRTQDVSTQDGTVLTDGGLLVKTVKSNAVSDQAVLGVPPETLYGLIKFGKPSGATATTSSSTVNVVVPITTAVAKLDSEVTAADKAGKDFVLVGGPCANTLVADLKTAGKISNGCSDWPARNFGLIQVVDDNPSTGHQTVVVAGTRAEDTRLASSVLQNYATKLSTVTGSKVEVSGSTLASATVTPA